jgi:hypothetical protein
MYVKSLSNRQSMVMGYSSWHKSIIPLARINDIRGIDPVLPLYLAFDA